MNFVKQKVVIPVKSQKMEGTLYVPDSDQKKLPGVVIFHGRGSSQARYTDRAKKLAQAGFITLIFSFRGCGESDGEFSKQTLKMGQEDALAGYDFLLKQKQVDQNRIGVWGGSYGGYQAALMVDKRKVHSLILAVPALYKNEWWEKVPEKVGDETTQAYRDGDDFSGNKALDSMSRYQKAFLMVQHELDEICPRKQTDAVFESAVQATPKEKKVVKGLPHRLDGQKERSHSNTITVEWFQKTLAHA